MTDEKSKDQKEELDTEILKKKLEECEKVKAEYLVGWQRSRADLLNYKKEEIERMKGFLGYASEELVVKLLPILDNFTQAAEAVPEDKRDDYFKGILQIKKQLEDFLKAEGVEEIKALGESFDPNLHEIIGEAEAEGKKQGAIIQEVQKGYRINGRLLRPAKVKVAK